MQKIETMTGSATLWGYAQLVGTLPGFDSTIFNSSTKDILLHSIWSVCHDFAEKLRNILSLHHLGHSYHATMLFAGFLGASEETMFRGKNFDILDILKKPVFAFADKLADLYKADRKNFRKHAVSIMVLIISSITFGLFHLQNLLVEGDTKTFIYCQVIYTTIFGLFLQKFSPQVDGILPLWVAHFLHNYIASA